MLRPINLRFPRLESALPSLQLAALPTPVSLVSTAIADRPVSIYLKHDDITATLYGGNKVRKLEYALQPAVAKGCENVATFGAAGSNHALATALFSRELGMSCTCFLGNQAATPYVATTLNRHIEIGTRIIEFGGSRQSRLRTLRENLADRKTWVVPLGGSSWRGTVGFVNAALELVQQLEERGLPLPERIYVATGTMGTAAGIGLGLALAGVDCEVQAVRVSEDFVTNEAGMARLVRKTLAMLARLDPSVPLEAGAKTRVRIRHGFFADGYARTSPATDEAVAFARDHLGIDLETTYTGKAMAALLHDLRGQAAGNRPWLFWNSYNSRRPVSSDTALDTTAIPSAFLRYFAPGE
jgi:D-cysteine desulfhydrase